MNCGVKSMTDKLKLFTTGMIQVLFVVMNTYFISRQYWQGVLVCGFLISIIWSWNVKRVAFGDWQDRIFYSMGAAFGSLVGLFISRFFA